MREIIKLNNLYLVREDINEESKCEYESPEGDFKKIDQQHFIFGEFIVDGKNKPYLIRAWESINDLNNLVAMPIIKYKNIFECAEKRNIDTSPRGYRTNFFSEGKFGLTKLFCKEEPVIEFLFLEDLKTNIPKLLVCSESLFEYLFREF